MIQISYFPSHDKCGGSFSGQITSRQHPLLLIFILATAFSFLENSGGKKMNTNVKKYIFLKKQLFLRVLTPVFGFWFCIGNIEHQEAAKKH